ncbi:HNH endonuclease [Shinella sp. AETb1-6]|uniref:HNH endonuclease n=1 Tax=Shinella sp. AETb1-6 TaxID=2692210 RepID=UPI001369CC09|nr:HNH endonuclease [Shinella sp. AETb1-6]MXN51866.1 HNH endonuclease [Shinella sp. AETb1-6]
MITLARLKSLLSYDPETGVFTRIQAAGTAKAGDAAGTITTQGYVQISVDGELFLGHRLAWFYTYGRWPDAHTDHVDGDRANNRIANLREASAAQNCSNHGPQTNNTSGAKGVYWSKIRKKWVAQIGVAKRVINLGGFEEFEAAVKARAAAEVQYQGEFRCQR